MTRTNLFIHGAKTTAIKKHIKTTKEKKGGIFTKENFLHLSNLRIIQESKKTQENKKTKKAEIKK